MLPFWVLFGGFLGSLGPLLGPPETIFGSLYGQEMGLRGVLGVSWGPLERPKPILEHQNRAQNRPRTAPRRKSHDFTKVSCMSAFEPQRRPKS